MISPGERKSSGEILRWRNVGHGTPQILPEGKQLNQFKFLPFSLLISDCQAEITGVLNGNRNYYVSPCERTGIWLCSK